MPTSAALSATQATVTQTPLICRGHGDVEKDDCDGQCKKLHRGRRGWPPDGDEGEQCVEQGEDHGEETEPLPVIIPENVAREGKERHRVRRAYSSTPSRANPRTTPRAISPVSPIQLLSNASFRKKPMPTIRAAASMMANQLRPGSRSGSKDGLNTYQPPPSPGASRLLSNSRTGWGTGQPMELIAPEPARRQSPHVRRPRESVPA